jgi:hypothetical protein
MTTNLNTNVLPLTPNDVAGSPDPNPLVTPQQYASITGDTASAVNDIEENISDVINDLCKELKRTLVYGQYTEAQFLYANGMVYPSATPLDPNQPVTANLSDNDNIYDPATDDSSGSSIVQGDGIWVGFFSPLPFMPFYTGVVPPQTVLTYWGGFTQSTLPSRLRRIICTICYYRLNPVVLKGMPGGVKSMSVGGVSISGDLSSLMDTDPALRKAIRGWRHPQTNWQS